MRTKIDINKKRYIALTPIKLCIDVFTKLENLGHPGKPRVIPHFSLHNSPP